MTLAASRRLLARDGTTGALRRLQQRSARPPEDPGAVLASVRRAARIVGGECLPQAVTLAVLLQRMGMAPLLLLGCRRDPRDGGWLAHAWVELDDEVLDPTGAAGFASLARLSAETDWLPSPVTPR
jgi:hypothetical protein